jgi:signal transduction histidine kinase/DNA-binding response OmpR family regulator
VRIRPLLPLRDSTWIWWLYLVGGASYPLWWWLGPRGPLDPWWPWWLIGGLYALASLVGFRRDPSRGSRLLFLPSFATAVHLHVLFALHPSSSFYGVAPAMNVFASLLILNDPRALLAFSVTVLGLSALPVVLGGGSAALYYAAGSATLLLLANRRAARARSEQRTATAGLRFALHEAKTRFEREKADRLQLQEELQVAQRMESLGRMAGAFAHEFNNQLMAIYVYGELMEQRIPPNSPLLSDLQKVRDATRGAADLTARLLAFSCRPESHGERADLTQMLRASKLVIEHLMSEKTRVVFEIPDEPCPVPVSPDKVEQVLVNLALNARDAMPDGGALAVELSRRSRSDVLIPARMETEELLQLAVTDSGAGIDPVARLRIFEPFYTTRRDEGHSGLGLSVVYGIVKRSGGHIRVTSPPGRGTRFEIFWPAGEIEKRPAPAPSRVESVRVWGRPRILLVEDQRALRHSLRRLLEGAGYAVLSAAGGKEALALARRSGFAIDALATDVALPGLGGVELIERLRAKRPGLRVVAFSGHVDGRRALPEDVTWLHKPFDFKQLRAALDAQLRPGADLLASLGGDDALADREADEARGLVDPETPHELRSMGLGGLQGDPEIRGDLPGRASGGDQAEHLPLASRQRWARRFRFGTATERVRNTAAERRSEVAPGVPHRVERFE